MKTSYLPATLLCDFYKVCHRPCYPEGTEVVYSTWTPRASLLSGVTEVVTAGTQKFIKQYLIKFFNENFFNRPKEEVINEYKRVIKYALFVENPDASHLEELHDLGYLPLSIKALPEGTVVPIRTPILTVKNTNPKFFWLTNYIESLMSTELWMMSTSATIAHEYRKQLDKSAKDTGGDPTFVPFQAHDFSMRGMGALEAGVNSGLGHLFSFTGSDSIPSICAAEEFYNANIEKELVGTSIPATEHSVQCANGLDERFTFLRLITQVYPAGMISIVSDTWDFWKVISETLPSIKNEIMARNGKLVIRPDSGDPVKILCGVDVYNANGLERAKSWARERAWDDADQETGDECFGEDEYTYIVKVDEKYYEITVEIDYNRYDKRFYYIDGRRVKDPKEITLTVEQKGLIHSLWDIFGGTLTSTGHKLLDSHIGAIYGDSITRARSKEICDKLKAKGFASTNVVFGVGSFTYQYNTRDTFGFAMKSTACKINGVEAPLFKDPKTDNGTKKSQKGCVGVYKNDQQQIVWMDGLSLDSSIPGDLLREVFLDGKILIEETMTEVRNRLADYRNRA